MGLTDCPHCWMSTCECGFEYSKRFPKPQRMAEFMVDILGYRSLEDLEEIKIILIDEPNNKIASMKGEKNEY